MQYCQQLLDSSRLSIGPLLNGPRIRTLWMKKRSNDWWLEIVNVQFIKEDWIENFRMTKETFEKIVQELTIYLQPNSLPVRTPVAIDKKIAMTIYKLASCCEYRVVGNAFGVHKSTVKKCFYQVVKAINTVLLSKYVKFPDEKEALRIANAVEKKTGMVQVIGMIDGTHIPILAPVNGRLDYINRKGWTSLICQAVVDHEYKFTDICCKFPGSVHDAAVLKNSNLYNSSHLKIPQITKNIDGIDVPYFLLGDPAYPLLTWLMKGYTGSVSIEEDNFNTYLSSARMAVENAFGSLKGRWRCLQKRIDIHHSFVPSVVSCCVTLHNIIELQHDHFNTSWLRNVEDSDVVYPQPTTHTTNHRDISLNVDDMKKIREHLKIYMVNNYPLRSSSVRIL
ncbi:uncharacterized protein LOC126553811 [Aphis gossypii]|uniref:uncharacterized protein LOC126553811 n=1 Tax=Aphis gossypii TaxID=80765 RepID=UPI0021592923|nr:uncharacterized protein LOC126553811 [Aphis gossypii]